MAILGGAFATSLWGATNEAPHFNRDVLPILAENCFACHGPDKANRKGGLQLHLRDYATAEARTGLRAIVPGNADESELIFRITADDPEDIMPQPKSGKKLSADEIEILRRWINAGAEYEPHWALIPPQSTSLPELGEDRHPIDQFVQKRLSEKRLKPAPLADRSTLLRRAYLDLIGLPPSLEEVDSFLRDDRPDAYERVIDRLLGSRHFGEKWARWWMDLAHYGDSDGIRLDSRRPFAWRYRQWVVDSLNADLPFDQFTIRQIAGDLLPDATPDEIMGTGFLRNTISDRQTGNADPALGRVRQIVDRTATVGVVWLGMSMACAECHDHKFDPISQKEFFQFYSFFNNAEEANINAPLPGELERYITARPEYEEKRRELLAPIAAELAELQQAWEERMIWIEQNPGADPAWIRAYELLVTQWGRNEGEGQFEGITIIKTPAHLRTAEQQERLQNFFLRNGRVIDSDRWVELKIPELERELQALNRKLPRLSRAQAVAETYERRPTYIHVRGDFRRPGEVVEPGVPKVLPPIRKEGDRELNRLDLAKWLVSPENPLPSRVTVNRLWQELFGRGIVPTSDNFGMRGESPSHPELLDWLAVKFPEMGWSIKGMLRLMMTSETYRQSSHARPELAEVDPNNALLARQARLRLSGELIRDASFATGGILNLEFGGPSVRPPQPESFIKENNRNVWVADEGAARYRRGLYTFLQRLTPFVQFANFDLPSSAQACTQRERSNTPLQALNLLNDPAFVEAAQGLARRAWHEVKGSCDDRLRHVYLLALARRPSPEEVSVLTSYLERQTTMFAANIEDAAQLAPQPFPGASQAESAAWITLASVMLNLDEFINRE